MDNQKAQAYLLAMRIPSTQTVKPPRVLRMIHHTVCLEEQLLQLWLGHLGTEFSRHTSRNPCWFGHRLLHCWCNDNSGWNPDGLHREKTVSTSYSIVIMGFVEHMHVFRNFNTFITV